MSSPLPLTGKTILVTRGKDQAKDFSAQIKKMGGTSIEIPLISFQRSKNDQEIQEAFEALDTYDWLVFTSRNGVEFFFEANENLAKNKVVLPKIAVVGIKTEQALKSRGYNPNLIPDEFVAEGLVAALKPYAEKGDSFLLARGNLSRSTLPKELLAYGGKVCDLIIYETVENRSKQETLTELLKAKQIDVLTFTSPSTVTNFIKLVSGIDWRELMKDTVIACIGPITKQALQDAGLNVLICPTTYTTEKMLDEIIHFYQGVSKS